MKKVERPILDYLKQMINNHFDTNIEINNRKRYISQPRMIFFYIARNYTEHTLSEIGSYLNRDHSSVCYAVKKVDNSEIYDKELRKELESFIQNHSIELLNINKKKKEILVEHLINQLDTICSNYKLDINNKYINKLYNILDNHVKSQSVKFEVVI